MSLSLSLRLVNRPSALHGSHSISSFSFLNTASSHATTTQSDLRRSYLYVPSSSPRMLQKSLNKDVKADTLVYDLEDSVAPVDKEEARASLVQFLQSEEKPDPTRVAVRVNGVRTGYVKDDLAAAASLHGSVRTLVLPKIDSAQDLDVVAFLYLDAYHKAHTNGTMQARGPVRMIASIESARALWDIGSIAAWNQGKEEERTLKLSGLLFAAEDYCADTGIQRTKSRQELLYTRSRIVLAAKAFGLEAIDMVNIHYKDKVYLEEESLEARQMGFTGKQAIHPSQVDVIQSTFLPSAEEVERAARILNEMERAHKSKKGAIGLGEEMIDMPMVLQARNVVEKAKAAGLRIPTFA